MDTDWTQTGQPSQREATASIPIAWPTKSHIQTVTKTMKVEVKHQDPTPPSEMEFSCHDLEIELDDAIDFGSGTMQIGESGRYKIVLDIENIILPQGARPEFS